MLQELEKLFGFRTSDTTNVELYLKRMDEMSKFDSVKRNKLVAVLINHIMKLESDVDHLTQVSQLDTKAPEAKDHTKELSTIKADITRLKKKVYPSK